MSELEAAVKYVARRYSVELIDAAKCLAEAAPDEVTFLRVWLGIGELARSGIFDFDPADVAGRTMAEEISPNVEEKKDGR